MSVEADCDMTGVNPTFQRITSLVQTFIYSLRLDAPRKTQGI